MTKESIKSAVEAMRAVIRDRIGEVRSMPRTPETSALERQLERDHDAVMAIALRLTQEPRSADAQSNL